MSGRGRYACVAAGVAALIVYGSLYPFDLHDGPALEGAVRLLAATWRDRPSRSDALANVILYFPLGFMLAKALAGRGRQWLAAAAVLACALLSVSVELTQVYDAGRDPALSDVYCNTLGGLLGAVAAALLGRLPAFPRAGVPQRPALVPLLLLGCLLAYRLYPYVPAADIYKYWLAVKPLVRDPRLDPVALLRHTAVGLAVALLLEDIAGRRRCGWWLAALLGAIVAARVSIVGAALSPAEVLGAAAAVALWFAWLARSTRRAAWVAALFTVSVIFEALTPFRFDAPHAFGWAPFRSFITGSISVAVLAFADKTFRYGALLWLCERAGWTPRRAVIFCASLLLALSLLQTRIPGRSAEITDTVLLLLVAASLRLLARRAA